MSCDALLRGSSSLCDYEGEAGGAGGGCLCGNNDDREGAGGLTAAADCTAEREQLRKRGKWMQLGKQVLSAN